MTTEIITSPGSTESTKETLVKDFKGIVGKADDLLKETGKSVADEFAAKRQVIAKNACRAASATDEYARDNPWRIIGVAAVAGLLLGALLGRR